MAAFDALHALLEDFIHHKMTEEACWCFGSGEEDTRLELNQTDIALYNLARYQCNVKMIIYLILYLFGLIAIAEEVKCDSILKMKYNQKKELISSYFFILKQNVKNNLG